MTSTTATSPRFVGSFGPRLTFAKNLFAFVSRALSLLSQVWRWLSISGLLYLFAPEYDQKATLRHFFSSISAVLILGGPAHMT